MTVWKGWVCVWMCELDYPVKDWNSAELSDLQARIALQSSTSTADQMTKSVKQHNFSPAEKKPGNTKVLPEVGLRNAWKKDVTASFNMKKKIYILKEQIRQHNTGTQHSYDERTSPPDRMCHHTSNPVNRRVRGRRLQGRCFWVEQWINH